jgi:hypothetical protein
MSLQEILYKTAIKLVNHGNCKDAVPLFWQAIHLGHVSSRAELAHLFTTGKIDLENHKDIDEIAFSLVKDHEDDQDCAAMKAILMWGSRGYSLNKSNVDDVNKVLSLTEKSKKSKFGKFMKGILHLVDSVAAVTSRYGFNVCRALKYFIKASEMGCDSAFYQIAKIYNFTSGYINIEKAIDNYKLAIKTGHLVSFEYLSKIYSKKTKYDDAAKIFFSLLKTHDLRLRDYAEGSLIELGFPYKRLDNPEVALTGKNHLIIDISNISAAGYDYFAGNFIRKLFEQNKELTGQAFGSTSTADHPCILSEILLSISQENDRLTTTLVDRIALDKESERVDLAINEAIDNYSEKGTLFIFSNDSNNEHGEKSIFNAVKQQVEGGRDVVTVVPINKSVASAKYLKLAEKNLNYKVISFIDFFKSLNKTDTFDTLKVSTSFSRVEEKYQPTPDEENAIIAAKCLQNKDRTVFKVNQCVLALLEGRWYPAIVESINSKLEYVYPYHIKLDETKNTYCMSVQQLKPARVKPAFQKGDTVLARTRLQGEKRDKWYTGIVTDINHKSKTPYSITLKDKTKVFLAVENVGPIFTENDKILSYWADDEKWYPAVVTKVQVPDENPYRVWFDGYLDKYEFSAQYTRKKKVASDEIVPEKVGKVSQKFKIQDKIRAYCEPYWEHGEVIGFNPNLECPYEVKLDTEGKIFIFCEKDLEAVEVESVANAKVRPPGGSAVTLAPAPRPPGGSVVSAQVRPPGGSVVSAQVRPPGGSAPAAAAPPAARSAAARSATHYAVAPPAPTFSKGEKVEAKWKGAWYDAIIRRNKEDGFVDIEFVDPTWRGTYYSRDPTKEIRPRKPRGGSIEDIYKKKYLKYKNKYIQLKLHFQ